MSVDHKSLLSFHIQDTELTEISNAVVCITEDCSIHGCVIWGMCRGSTAAAVGNVTHLWAEENIMVSIVMVWFPSMTVPHCTRHSRPGPCCTCLVGKHWFRSHLTEALSASFHLWWRCQARYRHVADTAGMVVLCVQNRQTCYILWQVHQPWRGLC